ncbi:hypothetical protein SAM23877_7199 [Streptomyces ambofaciens ATCC 23877]|uniref:Acyl-CoA dehydrogenase C-terminal domain-containing protein n=1 Tax=Streptomyces ambofaciens (strain ATCC 23877 / 3486 / DSM 40053 / JCM 4204 / NBRC 12836 / NRRL B-2516) TaxID=278992 RepID=A0A0K2B5B2_STRA7|nr:hypothetical protein SAM23877_7199 [Streptomyces ambofaciens ATCC 23877]
MGTGVAHEHVRRSSGSPTPWPPRARSCTAIPTRSPNRPTASAEGLDRFWRDVRTHTLHAPVAHKRREVGRPVLTGELPQPTRYS